MAIHKPFNARILSTLADVIASVHDLSFLMPLEQTSSNWKTTFKDPMHHCDLHQGVTRVHSSRK